MSSGKKNEKTSFSGMGYPPPELLKAYEDISPGSAKLILEQARANAESRRRMGEERIEKSYAIAKSAQENERHLVDKEFRESLVGTTFAFILAMTAVCGSLYYSSELGAPATATIISTVIGVGGLGRIFAQRRGKPEIITETKGLNEGEDKKELPSSDEDLPKSGTGGAGTADPSTERA